jgi:hypothetical protein
MPEFEPQSPSPKPVSFQTAHMQFRGSVRVHHTPKLIYIIIVIFGSRISDNAGDLSL